MKIFAACAAAGACISLSSTPARATAPNKTDIHIEVNTSTGDISFQDAAAAPAQFTLYNITSATSSLVKANLTTLTGRFPNWAVIQTKNSGISEGQSNTTYSATDSHTFDTITLQPGATIDLGNIFKLGGTQDLAFQWSAPQAGTGDPVSGTTFNGAPVDYIVAPEPASLGLLGLAAIGMLTRPKPARRAGVRQSQSDQSAASDISFIGEGG